MASVAYFVVLPFVRDVDSASGADEFKRARSGYSAISRRRALEGYKAGAIAIARTDNPAQGDLQDAVSLGRYGEMPSDLRAPMEVEILNDDVRPRFNDAAS